MSTAMAIESSATAQSVLHPAGPDASIIADFAWVLFIGGAVIFAGVMALMVIAARRRPEPVNPRRWIVGAGFAFPVVVLSILLVWSTWRSAELTPQTSKGAFTVGVTAKMWWWEVRYHDPASGREITSANEIRIPVGRPVYLGLTSSDVIHSLWIPALNGKMDTVPGRVTGLTIQADKPGVYRAQCAEYCGEQHARMALHVVAMAPDAFDRWLANEARPAATTAGAPDEQLLERGRAAFLAQRCQACHTVRGVGGESGNGNVRLGPDLTHVGSRLHIAAGTLRNHRGALAGWVADPQSIKPGARMPAAADLDGETLHALAAYLEHLK
ncbi:cytochrome c oxidase subunit II [Massilia sp.]|jgi:cytochrome c oxidase subunit 2|uniref:cytochrome c oxidase subunit II n=2 Tax=unclassified Massilia TaxID=2609279 RepID=UPI0028ADE54F|nr:cytochrome c oxidase subunit II [Massilia sp.]